MKTPHTDTMWFGITVIAAMAVWSTQGAWFHGWFEFILGRSANLVEMLAIGALGIVAATASFAAGARYFRAVTGPINAIIAGVVVSSAAFFLVFQLHIMVQSARNAGWTALVTVVAISFFAPKLFAEDKNSES